MRDKTLSYIKIALSIAKGERQRLTDQMNDYLPVNKGGCTRENIDRILEMDREGFDMSKVTEQMVDIDQSIEEINSIIWREEELKRQKYESFKPQ